MYLSENRGLDQSKLRLSPFLCISFRQFSNNLPDCGADRPFYDEYPSQNNLSQPLTSIQKDCDHSCGVGGANRAIYDGVYCVDIWSAHKSHTHRWSVRASHVGDDEPFRPLPIHDLAPYLPKKLYLVLT